MELAADEDKDEVYLDLAMEYSNADDYKSALEVLNRAIKDNPNNEAAIYEIAFCYDQLGDHEKSIKCYSDFIDENPYSFTAWYNLGNAYSKLEDYEKRFGRMTIVSSSMMILVPRISILEMPTCLVINTERPLRTFTNA